MSQKAYGIMLILQNHPCSLQSFQAIFRITAELEQGNNFFTRKKKKKKTSLFNKELHDLVNKYTVRN